MFKKKNQAPTHRPPLKSSQIEYIFASAIRLPELFAEVKDLVKDAYFADTEEYLSLVWHATCDYQKESHCLPTREILIAACNDMIQTDRSCLGTREPKDALRLIERAFKPGKDQEPVELAHARRLLKKFLEDRLSLETFEEFSSPQTPIELDQLFTKLQERASAISNLTAGEVPLPFEDGWDAQTAIGQRIPTGLSFLDYYMAGGAAPNESYAIMGAYGSGKSTMAVMITTTFARRAYHAWLENNRSGAPARAYHFHYEDPRDDIRLLALSYMSEIPRARMEELVNARDPEQYSTVGNYRDYEIQRFQSDLNAGVQPDGERERYVRAIEIMNACWRPIDMTGGDEANPGRGSGLVPEMAQIVRRDLGTSGASCATVVADYAIAAARAHFSANNRDRNEMRLVLQEWPFIMKRQLAIPFQCPVWSMQQLNTESNAARPGYLPQMVDTPECRSFCENTNFAFVMGLATRGGQFPFIARKHRRAGDLPPIVLTLRGEQARIDDTRNEWVLDERTKQIVGKAEFDRLQHMLPGVTPGSVPVEQFINEESGTNGSARGVGLPASQRARERRARSSGVIAQSAQLQD
jgi:hypothetical protein